MSIRGLIFSAALGASRPKIAGAALEALRPHFDPKAQDTTAIANALFHEQTLTTPRTHFRGPT